MRSGVDMDSVCLRGVFSRRRNAPSCFTEARRFPSGRRSHTKNDPRRRSASCGHTGRFSATPGKGALPIGSIQLFSFFQKTKRNGGGPDPRPRRLYVAWGPARCFKTRIHTASSRRASGFGFGSRITTHGFFSARRKPARIPSFSRITKHETRNTAFYRYHGLSFIPACIPMQHLF